MKIEHRTITLEERTRKEKTKKTAKMILVKIPLILWVLVAIGGCCASDVGDIGTRFFVILAMSGAFVVPWCTIAKIVIDLWD